MGEVWQLGMELSSRMLVKGRLGRHTRFLGQLAVDGVKSRDGEGKEEPIREVRRNWQPWDWEGERGHPTLVTGNARWRGREAAEEEETKDRKAPGKEETKVDHEEEG